MNFSANHTDHTLDIYLSLAQYPILSTQIRAHMRQELFDRGIIKPTEFETEVRAKAISSQKVEGIKNPIDEEPTEVWELRLNRVREYLTDFYFAYNLPQSLFEQIIKETLSERGAGQEDFQVSFNPELAPQSMLFEQATMIENLVPQERSKHEPRLQEIKVVLIRTMVSDHLQYVNIAKDWFTITDLNEIRARKIGRGKIGGKSAGMLLAARILSETGDEEIQSSVKIPESFFIGADLTYIFMSHNGLIHWNDQKYKSEDQIRTEYNQVRKEFSRGKFPTDILDQFRELLERVGRRPLIVRSSSLLEDNFGTSFAGKYESHFCPNQGSLEDNLYDLTQAIQNIYGSIFNPDVLLYRRAKGLQDYDERMALLVQEVQGEKFDRYFLPHAAGVAFSRNLYRWSPKIRRDDGFIRLVWGLGTRAVERLGNDYPRLVALSHPLLHPETSVKSMRRYSQHFVDLIDLEENQFKTISIEDVLSPDYKVLPLLVLVDQGEYLTPIRMAIRNRNKGEYILTFDELLQRTPASECLSKMLRILETHYQSPVDTEFTIQVINPSTANPGIEISLLQCRPQSHYQESDARLPNNLRSKNIVFSTQRLAPKGRVSNITYVVFISPEGYFSLPTPQKKSELAASIGRVNLALADHCFICVGPGRWGTVNPDLGIHIGFSQLFNTRALVEITGSDIGSAPEASFGTHFFQDLVESNTYPLAICLDDEDMVFNQEFFYKTPNSLHKILPDEFDFDDSLRLIKVDSYRSGYHLELIMDNDKGKSVAFLERNR